MKRNVKIFVEIIIEGTGERERERARASDLSQDIVVS